MTEIEARDLSLGEDHCVSPGLHVQRRSFLGLAAATLLAPSVGRAGVRAVEEEPQLSLEEFLEEVVPVAKRLVAGLASKPARAAEDRYLFTLASFACRLGAVEAPEMRATSQGSGAFIGASWVGDPFVVLHWRLEPGATIRTHAHTYGNVCTLGLEGAARVHNYETVEEPDFASSEPVLLRRLRVQHLDVGGINLVPLSHGFCHGFEAGPEGARGLDITTRLAERTATPYLELEPKPVDAALGLHRGRWSVE